MATTWTGTQATPERAAGDAPALTVPVGAPTPGSTPDALAGRQVVDTSRGSSRPELLDSRMRILQAQQLKVETHERQLAAQRAGAARAKAAAQRKAAAARKAAVRRLGYQPGTTDPRSIARQLMASKYGWGGDQFSCYNNIIMRESMWVTTATNAGSGAYGIPQALPASKLSAFGADWRTNPATQILWGLDYVQKRYGTPCGAWSWKSSHGWY